MKKYFLLKTIITFLFISMIGFSDNYFDLDNLIIEVTTNDNIFYNNDGTLWLIVQKDNESNLNLILKNNVIDSENLIEPFNEERVFEAVFTDDNNFLILNCGGSTAIDQKFLLTYYILQNEYYWDIPINNDFLVNLAVNENGWIASGGRNTGHVFLIDIKEGNILFSTAGFAQHTYFVFFNDNYVLANGADSYSDEIFHIRIWDEYGNLINTLPGYSDSYIFDMNPEKQLFLSYNPNTYINPDQTIEVIDIEGINNIAFNSHKDLAECFFSSDGEYIIIVGTDWPHKSIKIYDLSGEFIKNYTLEISDEYPIIYDVIYLEFSKIIVVVGEFLG